MSRFLLEWQIENFSCWRETAHGGAIVCRYSSMVIEPGQIELSLFPKVRGLSDPMEIAFNGPNILFREEGELTFLAPDGFVLFKRQVNEGFERDLHRVTGPSFNDVLSRIEQSEDLHGDHLTIQFECRTPSGHRIHMKTTLDVVHTSLKFTKPEPCPSLGDPVTLASISYSGDKRLHVMYETENQLLYLKAVPECMPLFQHRLSVFDGNGDPVEQPEFVASFIETVLRNCWQLTSLESGGHCVLRLKIINRMYKSQCSDFFPYTRPLRNTPKRIQDSAADEGSHHTLSKDLQSLYQGQDFADLQLKCGGVSFPAHRTILCARSPVFRTMLSTDMVEAASSSVNIEDLDPTSLDLFLHFLYTGRFKDTEACHSALKLYYAADKYQVPSLLRDCADHLCANVGISSVCDVLALGDRHGDERVTSAAQNFILRNFKEVTRSGEWREYMNVNPQLLVKTLTHFAANGYVGYICT